VAADPTRRVVLAVSAALPLLLTGCKGLGVLASPPRPPPDVTLLQDAIRAEELMIARYGAAIRALRGSQPALVSVLLPLLAQHDAHLAQLRSRLIVPASAAPSASLAPRQPASALPAGPQQAVAYLQAAEHDWAARLLHQLLSAPPSLAQLLASISASEATHVPALAAAGRSA
jgi:hypothetical protein